MSVDHETVRRIARLARIAVTEDDVPHLQGELNAILSFVEQLNEVDVEGVEPMTSVTPMAMKKRADAVTDGGYADAIVKNAPATEDHFFLVPKVVECGREPERDHPRAERGTHRPEDPRGSAARPGDRPQMAGQAP